MEKTIIIDGKEVKLKNTAGFPLRYKAQFGRDFFVDMFKMKGLEKLKDKDPEDFTYEEIKQMDYETFFNIIWVLAKTADKTISDPLSWFDEFEQFPMDEVIPQAQDMIMHTFNSTKKK